MKGIFLSSAEIEAMHGLGPLSLAAYLNLRAWMDLRSGVVGVSRPVTLAMLAAYTETHVTRGRGFEVVQPSQKEVRCALDRLVRAGLLVRLAGDRLAFSMPMAVKGSARAENAGRNEGAARGVVRGAAKPAIGTGFDAMQGALRDDPPVRCRARHQSVGETASTHHTAATPEPGLRAREAVAAGGRAEAIAGLLRGKGVRLRVDDPVLGDLVQRGVTDDDLLAAVEVGRKARAAEGSVQPIGVRYVLALLDRVKPKAPTATWWASEQAMLAKGAEMGLSPRVGEGWSEFKGRIRAAIGRAA